MSSNNNSLRQFGIGFTTLIAQAYHNAVFVDNSAITAMGAEIGGTGAWQITNNSFYYRTPSTDTYIRASSPSTMPRRTQNLSSDYREKSFLLPTPDRWATSQRDYSQFSTVDAVVWLRPPHSVNPYWGM